MRGSSLPDTARSLDEPWARFAVSLGARARARAEPGSPRRGARTAASSTEARAHGQPSRRPCTCTTRLATRVHQPDSTPIVCASSVRSGWGGPCSYGRSSCSGQSTASAPRPPHAHKSVTVITASSLGLSAQDWAERARVVQGAQDSDESCGQLAARGGPAERESGAERG